MTGIEKALLMGAEITIKTVKPKRVKLVCAITGIGPNGFRVVVPAVFRLDQVLKELNAKIDRSRCLRNVDEKGLLQSYRESARL